MMRRPYSVVPKWPWPSGWGPAPLTARSRAFTRGIPGNAFWQLCSNRSYRGWWKQLFSVFSRYAGPSGWGPAPLRHRIKALTKGYTRECLFGNFVITKVMGDNEISYFKMFLDVHDHLGEVQHLRQPGVGHYQGVSQGLIFWQCCFNRSYRGWWKQLFEVVSGCPWPSGWGQEPLTPRSRVLTPDCPRE